MREAGGGKQRDQLLRNRHVHSNAKRGSIHSGMTANQYTPTVDGVGSCPNINRTRSCRYCGHELCRLASGESVAIIDLWCAPPGPFHSACRACVSSSVEEKKEKKKDIQNKRRKEGRKVESAHARAHGTSFHLLSAPCIYTRAHGEQARVGGAGREGREIDTEDTKNKPRYVSITLVELREVHYAPTSTSWSVIVSGTSCCEIGCSKSVCSKCKVNSASPYSSTTKPGSGINLT